MFSTMILGERALGALGFMFNFQPFNFGVDTMLAVEPTPLEECARQIGRQIVEATSKFGVHN